MRGNDFIKYDNDSKEKVWFKSYIYSFIAICMATVHIRCKADICISVQPPFFITTSNTEDSKKGKQILYLKKKTTLHPYREIEGKVYVGEVKEKEKAKEQYDKAVSAGKTAGLVKWDLKMRYIVLQSVAVKEVTRAVLQGFWEKDGEVYSVCQHCRQQ